MATNIEVIIGTYEEFLLGYKVEESSKVPISLKTIIKNYFSAQLSYTNFVRMFPDPELPFASSIIRRALPHRIGKKCTFKRKVFSISRSR